MIRGTRRCLLQTRVSCLVLSTPGLETSPAWFYSISKSFFSGSLQSSEFVLVACCAHSGEGMGAAASPAASGGFSPRLQIHTSFPGGGQAGLQQPPTTCVAWHAILEAPDMGKVPCSSPGALPYTLSITCLTMGRDLLGIEASLDAAQGGHTSSDASIRKQTVCWE